MYIIYIYILRERKKEKLVYIHIIYLKSQMKKEEKIFVNISLLLKRREIFVILNKLRGFFFLHIF